jgi:hypothetical protein
MCANISSDVSQDPEASVSTYEAFPFNKADRILRLLRAGFGKKTCPFLAKMVHQVVELHFQDFREKVRVLLSKSITLYGICDT